MKTVKHIFSLLKAISKGDSAGDVAALKATILGSSENLSLKTKVAPLIEKDFTPLKNSDLQKCPKGSLGSEYLRFIEKNQLKPINFSSLYLELFKKYPVTIRYIQVHDLYHVLLGFDSSIAGELGVYTFVRQREYSSALNKAFKTAYIVSSIAKLWGDRKAIKEAYEKGKSMGLNSHELLYVDWRERMNDSLQDLRVEFNINSTEQKTDQPL